MTQAYRLDFGAGAVSPLQIFDGSGNVMFDARYASRRAYLKGSAALTYNNIDLNLGTSSYTTVTFASGHFSNAPAYCCVEYAALLVWPEDYWFGGTWPVGLYSPFMLAEAYDSIYQLYGSGMIAISDSGHLQIGNLDTFQTITAYYMVFENPVNL